MTLTKLVSIFAGYDFNVAPQGGFFGLRNHIFIWFKDPPGAVERTGLFFQFCWPIFENWAAKLKKYWPTPGGSLSGFVVSFGQNLTAVTKSQ